jgi:hypothetical protein
MAEVVGCSVDPDEVKSRLADSLAQEFELEWTERRRIEADRILDQETLHD